MQPHQERVVTEKAELDAKLEKLLAFIEGSVYAALPLGERGLLAKQSIVMTEYSHILAERIEAF